MHASAFRRLLTIVTGVKASPAEPRSDERLRKLEAENHALTEAKRDLEAFVYAISHDLRAPLRTIKGFSTLLEEDIGRVMPVTGARSLAGIRAGIDRMHELLDCWLNIARAGQAQVRPAAVDLALVADQLRRELQMADPSRKITVLLGANLGAYADPVLVRELLHNLMGNAWKFTQDSPAATIEIGARREGADVHYYVRDNGIGFDPADVSKLFQPFRQLQAASRFGGAGVGLAIAQRIVERHGGRIWAEGSPGVGATFWFSLPAAVPSESIL